MKLPAPVLTAGGAGRRRTGVVGHMPASGLPGRSFEMLDTIARLRLNGFGATDFASPMISKRSLVEAA